MSRDRAKIIQGWEYWVERVTRTDGPVSTVVMRVEDPSGAHRYQITFASGDGRRIAVIARGGGADGRGFVPPFVYSELHRVASGILGEERGKPRCAREKDPA